MPDSDPGDLDDLLLGELPRAEAGFNMGRVVAVLLGDEPAARHRRRPSAWQ